MATTSTDLHEWIEVTIGKAIFAPPNGYGQHFISRNKDPATGKNIIYYADINLAKYVHERRQKYSMGSLWQVRVKKGEKGADGTRKQEGDDECILFQVKDASARPVIKV